MRKKPPINDLDIAAIRDEIIDYLVKNSLGRQGKIASIVGVRRETICGYVTGSRTLSDISTLQALYEWMQRDKREGASP